MLDKSPKKRKNQEEETKDEEPIAKTQRYSASEFRSKLKGSDPIGALKEFLKDEKEDRIEEYIREGGSLSELLAILNNFNVKKNVPQAIPIFQAITIFIIKCMSNFPEKQKELVEECRQLLNIHLPIFQSMLTAVYSPRQKKVALKLLTAVISCNEDLAWEILISLKLTSQDVEALSFARKQSDPTSVREHFIRFLMSFLIDQPLSLVRKFISQRGLLVSIFSGLKSDSYHDVLMVLTTLKSNIVDVKEINKSTKLSIFNTASLCSLISVYSWDPRANISHPSNTEISLEGRDEVRKHLHELLLVLLTSVKIGVVFNDPSIGTTHREFNELITSVISGFGKPWGDEMREDLFVKMLSACPDVIKQAYRQMDSFISDFDSPRWIQGINFFNKVIDQLNLQVSMLPLKSRTTLIKTVFLSPNLIAKLVKSLSSEDATCRAAAVSCLSTCLKRLHSHQQYYIPDVVNNYLISNVSLSEIFIENMEHLRNDIQSMNYCSYKELLDVLDCLLYSHRICPQLLDSIRYKKKYYDFLRDYLKRVILRKDLTNRETKIDEMDVESNDEISNIQLLSKLASLKIIDLLLIIWPMDSSQDDYEYWLEDLSECISPNPKLIQESLSIIKQILESTGFFLGYCESELNVWMYCLSKHLTFDSVKLIVKSIKYAGINAKVIYGDIYNAERLTISEKEIPSQSLKLEDFIKASEKGDDASISGKCGNLFSLSIPFISMLKILQDEQFSFECDKFVVALIVHLLHHQVNSEVLLSLLRLYEKGKAASLVIDYAESWTNSSGSLLLIPPAFSDNSIFSIASNYLLATTSEIPDLDAINEDEEKLLLSQILFCSVRGCDISASTIILGKILSKNADLAPSVLKYLPLIDTFLPRKPLDLPSNSTQLVITAMKMSDTSQHVLAPYQSRLAFELRYALRKKSGLNDCVAIDEILDAIKLLESDIKYLVDHCFPLPKKLLQHSCEWRPVQEFLLRESIRVNVKMKHEALIEFINEIMETQYEFSSDKDCKFLDTFSLYLDHNFCEADWDKNMEILSSNFLKILFKCPVWSEKLANFLYKQVAVDLNSLPLGRLADMLESGVNRMSANYLYELIESLTTDLTNAVLNPCHFPWIDKITASLHRIKVDTGECDIKNLCADLISKGKEMYLSISNLRLLEVFAIRANMEVEMFSLAQYYLLQLSSHKDTALRLCLADILERFLPCEECFISEELMKLILAVSLKEPLPRFVRLISASVKYNRSLMATKQLFALLTSHSLFLNSMLSNKTDIKYEVLVLLETILRKNESLMKSSHLAVYFSAYNATLSLHDQIIFQILKLYEENGINIGEYKPYVWGETAAQRYSVNLKRKTLDDDSGCPTVQLLDINIIQNTIKYFPTARTLDENKMKTVKNGNDIYDVAFLLGALSQVVGPDSTLYPSQIQCAGVTSLAFIALGSLCPGVRAAGYHILYRHYTSLTQRKNDQIWSHLVEKLQRSICQTNNARLNGPLSVFLARASLIMSEPLHPLYHHMHNFILAKPIFNLDTVPAFLEFFHSSDPVTGKILQNWILDVIRDGLRDQEDFQIVLSSFTTKLLLDFYGSKLSTRKTQLSIEHIVEKCIACDSKRNLLTKEYSLIPWLVFNKKYDQALRSVPTSYRYEPFRKFVKDLIRMSMREKAEKKIAETV